MSQKANPTLIGAFVFGAIVIAIGAVIYFGAANLFAKKQAFVTYFQQSVNGLGVGSNVKYKGVPVGKVTRIQLKFEGRDQAPIVKVTYEIDTTNLLNKYGLSIDLASRKLNDRNIENGFRAKLDFESLISGQLFIALDFYKDAAPVVLREPANSDVLEIPPQPSDIEAILADLTKAIGNLGSIDFSALAKDVQSLIVSARNGIDSMHLEKLGASLNRASDSASALLNGDQVKGVLTSIHESFDQLTTTLKSLNPAVNDLKPALDQAKGALANLQKSTAELNQILRPDSSLRYQLDSSLSEINAAAASIQQLSDFLQRHPNSILFGRKSNANQP
jgi:paraquat-inducible protein B